MRIRTEAVQCMVACRGIPGPDQVRKLYSRLHELSPLAARGMQFILLAYVVRCDRVDKEQFYKAWRARRHREVDTIKALPRSPGIYLEALCALTLYPSFKCALASNACNWGLFIGDIPSGYWKSFMHLSRRLRSIMGVDLTQRLMGEKDV